MNSSFHLFRAALLGLSVVGAIACGSASPDTETSVVQSASEAVRPLRAAELVGPITYGETKSVSYTGYVRAFSLANRLSTDIVDVTITAPAGTPMAWIVSPLHPEYNLTFDGNNGNRHTAHVRLERGGLMGDALIVFRDKALRPQSMTVTLASQCNPDETEGCDVPPPPSEDPFSAASCTGLPTSQSQVEALFPRGSNSVFLGTSPVVEHSRSCNTVTGCSAWSAARATAAPIVQTDSRRACSSLPAQARRTSLRFRLGAMVVSEASVVSLNPAILFDNNDGASSLANTDLTEIPAPEFSGRGLMISRGTMARPLSCVGEIRAPFGYDDARTRITVGQGCARLSNQSADGTREWASVVRF